MAKRKAREQPNAEFVLDCSITMAWYFEDEAVAFANQVRKALSRAAAVVPALWPLEVANILVLGERRQRSTQADATTWLGYLRRLPIRVDGQTATRAWSETLPIARRCGVSAYDAAYLEVALRLGLPLASLDDRLKSAAAAVGVPEFQP